MIYTLGLYRLPSLGEIISGLCPDMRDVQMFLHYWYCTSVCDSIEKAKRNPLDHGAYALVLCRTLLQDGYQRLGLGQDRKGDICQYQQLVQKFCGAIGTQRSLWWDGKKDDLTSTSTAQLSTLPFLLAFMCHLPYGCSLLPSPGEVLLTAIALRQLLSPEEECHFITRQRCIKPHKHPEVTLHVCILITCMSVLHSYSRALGQLQAS